MIDLVVMMKTYLTRVTPVVSRLFSRGCRTFDRLTGNRNLAIAVLFFLTIGMGITGNLLKGSADDPSDDGAFYYDAAENLKDGRGFRSDIKQYWLDDWEETEEEGKIESPYFGIVTYPLFQSCVLRIDDSLMAIRIANSILSGLTVVVMFALVSKLFDERIAFLSSVLFIFNPLFFIMYTSILSEAFFLMIFMIPFYVLLRKDMEEILNRDLIIAGVISTIAFLSRMVGLLVVIGIIVWFLRYREWKKATVYGAASAISVLPWIIWNRVRMGYFFPFSHIAYTDKWPEAPTTISAGGPSSPLIALARDLLAFSTDLPSIQLFFILVPFIFIGIVNYSRDRKISLLIIFSLLSILFHLKVNYSMRYMIPIVPMLIPLGLRTFLNVVKRIEFRTILDVRISSEMVFAGFFSFILIVSALSIGNIILDARDSISENHNAEKYEFIAENASADAIICSTEPRHAHYFTERQTIILATNLDRSWLDEYIGFYNISYIVLEEISKEKYEDNSFLYGLYEGNETYLLGNHSLELSHEEPGYGNDMLFYRVERLQNDGTGASC